MSAEARMREQLDEIIRWHRDCDAVQETVDHMNSELAPLGLVAHLEDRIMVIRRMPTVRKPKRPTLRRHAFRQGTIEVRA